MHYHGYRWDNQADNQFGRFSDETPPEIVRENLAQRVVPPTTWSDPDAAVNWVNTEMGTDKGGKQTPPLERLMHPDHRPPVEDILRTGLDYVRDELRQQRDVVWGEWLRGGRLVRAIVVCCPGGMGCPSPPRH